MTSKKYLTSAIAAMCDDKSYFTYDKEQDTLFCNIVTSAKRLALKKDVNLFEVHKSNFNEKYCAESFFVLHTYLLYLAKIDKLDCDKDVEKLFLQKDTYKGFFDKVINTLSQIFILGLNNINYDVTEKVKALYVEAASYRIEFLKLALNQLYTKLVNILDKNSSYSLDSTFHIICSIINTIEAMRSQNDRNKLINLYGLNNSHGYLVSNMPVIACGYSCYDFSITGSTNKSNRFYYYDLASRRFLVIRTIENDVFWGPVRLFNTDTSLYKITFSWANFKNAYLVDNKLVNSESSSAELFDEQNPDKEKDKIKLYDLVAFHDIELLKEYVYGHESHYFKQKDQTDGLHLIKIKSVVSLSDSYSENKFSVVEDMSGNKFSVFLIANQSTKDNLAKAYSKSKKNELKDCYLLLRCPIISGIMQPTMETVFFPKEKKTKS